MDLCVTDPPYNVAYGEKVKTNASFKNKTRQGDTIKNDNQPAEQFRAFLVAVYKNILANIKAGGAYYIWHADTNGLVFREALEEAGGTIRQNLIWAKNQIVLGHSDYQWRHEPCLYGWKDGAGHYFTPDRTQTTVYQNRPEIGKMKKEELKQLVKELLEPNIPTTVINEDKPQHADLHPTMKPVILIARLVRNSSRKDEKVIDPFGGSGTTLIACEQLGRSCYTMELDPKYCDVIIERWQEYTGQTARLLQKGETNEA